MSSSPVSMAGKFGRASLYFFVPLLIYVSTNDHSKEYLPGNVVFWCGALAFGLTSLRAYMDTSNGDKKPDVITTEATTTVTSHETTTDPTPAEPPATDPATEGETNQ